jgi:hypothetical protein
MIILSILLNFNAYLSLRVLAKQSVIRMRLLLRRSGSQCRFLNFIKLNVHTYNVICVTLPKFFER